MEHRKGGKRDEALAQTDDSYSDCNGIEKSNQSCCQIVGMLSGSITVTTDKKQAEVCFILRPVFYLLDLLIYLADFLFVSGRFMLFK